MRDEKGTKEEEEEEEFSRLKVQSYLMSSKCLLKRRKGLSCCMLTAVRSIIFDDKSLTIQAHLTSLKRWNRSVSSLSFLSIQQHFEMKRRDLPAEIKSITPFFSNRKNNIKHHLATYRTSETFGMISTAHGFEIFVTGFNWKLATCTFRLKHTTII